MEKETITKLAKAAIAISLVAAFGHSVYDSIQHDWRIHNGFRDQVLKDPTPHLVTVETDGVTREGFLNRGAALTGDISTAFIIAQSPEAACWYTTLRVVKGQENLPVLQKIFGGAEYEEMFANQSFDQHRCAPIAGQKTIQDLAPAAPKP